MHKSNQSLKRTLQNTVKLMPILAFFFGMPMAYSEEEEIIEEQVVVGDLNSLPGENVDSIFGFGKSILETPRSASTISEEMMDRFNMQDIDELILVSPGSFTQSFFGVAGALDVRGTPGETYFRGVRRLDNPGNFPTPIGASDRVDIVRGPASPIYGPAKIGGYLNFNPKSARIEETGAYIAENTGALSYTTGNWDKSILTAEIGGPAEIGGKPMGFYLYGELENSGSFYKNAPGVEQSLIQASFDVDLSDTVQLQFGGMYHDFAGAQNAGWNRITQDLIDNGTYITGSPASLDLNGDGKISHQEFFGETAKIAGSEASMFDMKAANFASIVSLAICVVSNCSLTPRPRLPCFLLTSSLPRSKPSMAPPISPISLHVSILDLIKSTLLFTRAIPASISATGKICTTI